MIDLIGRKDQIKPSIYWVLKNEEEKNMQFSHTTKQHTVTKLLSICFSHLKLFDFSKRTEIGNIFENLNNLSIKNESYNKTLLNKMWIIVYQDSLGWKVFHRPLNQCRYRLKKNLISEMGFSRKVNCYKYE